MRELATFFRVWRTLCLLHITIDFHDDNHVGNPLTSDTTDTADPVSAGLFGGIYLDTQTNPRDTDDAFDISATYDDHFEDALAYTDLTFIRFPDGEMPDGFAVDKDPSADENWIFRHNLLNDGDRLVNDPRPGDWNETALVPGDIDEAFLESLVPAIRLDYPDFVHPDLIKAGHMGLSDAMALAVENGTSFALVLPEFQYLKVPQTLAPGAAFDPDDHVKHAELKADVKAFLIDLLVNEKYGPVPDDFILELGNEDYFGWNKAYFSPDSTIDIDSYSAYAFAVLEAVKEFRDEHQAQADDFKVAIQVRAEGWADELEANFIGATAILGYDADDLASLFGQIDVLDTNHNLLDASLDSAAGFEGINWIEEGITAMLALINPPGQVAKEVEIYNSAWSVEHTNTATQVDLSAAAVTLSVISSLAELGVDYAALWGIGSSHTHDTEATWGDGLGGVDYGPHMEVLRLMAESTPGTWQLETASKDNISGKSDTLAYAFEDSSKA